MKIFGFLSFALLLALPVPVAAQGKEPEALKTGGAFIRDCPLTDSPAEDMKGMTQKEIEQVTSCVAFLAVTSAFAEAFHETSTEPDQDICVPKEADLIQLQRIGLKFIHANPELWEYDARKLLLVSWRLKFPCRA